MLAVAFDVEEQAGVDIPVSTWLQREARFERAERSRTVEPREAAGPTDGVKSMPFSKVKARVSSAPRLTRNWSIVNPSISMTSPAALSTT
jgi:hypothetical protein